jgi:hypothetical protein
MRYLGKQPRVSGDRIDGGEITDFASTGIDDNATETKVTVADDGVDVGTDLDVTGNITTEGTISSTSTDASVLGNNAFVFNPGTGQFGIGKVPATGYNLDGAAPGLKLRFADTSDDASEGPVMEFVRDSASPAADDLLGVIRGIAKNSAGEEVVYSELAQKLLDPTDGAEDAEFDIRTMQNGTLRAILQINAEQTIFNPEQIDMDFLVKSETDQELFVVNTGTSRVGIGTETPEEILHVVGDVKIDGTITFSNQASGAGSVEFTIQDELNAGDDAYAAVVFKDSTSLNVGQVATSGGKLHITSQHGTSGEAGIHFGLGYTTDTEEDYEYLMMMEEENAETIIVSSSANISFDNSAGTISSSNSGDFSSLSVGDTVDIEGASNAANNRTWRILEIAGDVLTVIDRRGNKPTTETGGSITVLSHDKMVMIPNTINHYSWTAPQSDNSDRVATTSYVRTAVDNVLDSAPGALDTLNELAAALGDDANFATTMTNSLATKLNLAGGTMTGFLSLHTDPTASAHAANKNYVDTATTPKANRDFDNLTATGETNLEEYVEDYASGMITSATHGGLAVSYDDSAGTLAFNVNDPVLGVTATGDVTGSGNATMTDLGNTTVSVGLTLGNDVIEAKHLDTEDGTNNIINGLPELASEESFQNDDYIIFADHSAGGALRKVRKGKAIPPAFTEDLGYFAIAMS